jgi:hypothetical protein
MALGKTINRSVFSKRLGLDYDSKKSGLNNALRSQPKRKKRLDTGFPLKTSGLKGFKRVAGR